MKSFLSLPLLLVAIMATISNPIGKHPASSSSVSSTKSIPANNDCRLSESTIASLAAASQRIQPVVRPSLPPAGSLAVKAEGLKLFQEKNVTGEVVPIPRIAPAFVEGTNTDSATTNIHTAPAFVVGTNTDSATANIHTAASSNRTATTNKRSSCT